MTLKGFKLKLAANLEDYQYEICICDFPKIPLFHIELPGEINSVSISYYSGLITYWLLEVENTIATLDYTDQAAYAALFSDATAAQQKIENIFGIKKGDYPPKSWFFLAAFYKGLFIYLRDGERWKRFDALILTLYAAWQWYNIIKTLDASSENRLKLPKPIRLYPACWKAVNGSSQEQPELSPAWCRASIYPSWSIACACKWFLRATRMRIL